MMPIDLDEPFVVWFKSWRKRVALAKMEPQNQLAWSGLAMVAQMRYVTLAAIAVVKEARHE